MGFIKNFIGTLLAHIVHDNQKEKEKAEKDRIKWNAKFAELQQLEDELNALLARVGAHDSYVSDVSCINNGTTSIELRKMRKLIDKVQKYISLGGDGQIIFNLNNIDDYIERTIYLKSEGLLDKQVDYCGNTCDEIKQILNNERYDFSALTKKIKERHVYDTYSSDINSLTGIEFEHICQNLLEKMGMITETTKASGDGGIDIIAYNTQPMLAGKYIIQCKRYTGSVGEPIIRDLYGVVNSERANKGILITTSFFTSNAKTFADGKQIELIDGSKLAELLLQYGIVNETVSSDDIKLEEILGIYAHNYEYYYKMKQTNLLKSYCGRVEVLHYAISMQLFKYIDQPILSTQKLNFAAQKLMKDLSVLVENPSLVSLKGKFIYYISIVLAGEAAFWNGEFTKAISFFTLVLDEWDDGKKSSMFISSVIGSIFSMLNIMGLSQYVDLYYKKYDRLIALAMSDHKEKLAKAGPGWENKSAWENLYARWANDMMNVYNNRYKPYVFTNHRMYDACSSDDELYMTEKCIDWNGEISIPTSYYYIDIDNENDRLISSSDSTNGRVEGSVIISDISKVIEREKRCFLNLMEGRNLNN